MLSGFFIGGPRFAFVLSIVIVLAGLIAVRATPVAELPEIAPPQVGVTASYPGPDAQVAPEAVALFTMASVIASSAPASRSVLPAACVSTSRRSWRCSRGSRGRVA